MRKFDSLTFTGKIKWRIRILWCILIFMLIYMVVVGEIGGDSRIMTPLADIVSRILFFGGIVYIIQRIMHNKKLLTNRKLLEEQHRIEQDERNQYLHDKSGGIVWDILLICLLFIACTTALFHMAAFYTSFIILVVAILLKLGVYFLYSRM